MIKIEKAGCFASLAMTMAKMFVKEDCFRKLKHSSQSQKLRGAKRRSYLLFTPNSKVIASDAKQPA
jgi:hypothetical protein